MHTILDYLNNDYKALDATETIDDAQDFFLTENFTHFPVLEDGVFLGNLSRDNADILNATSKIADNRYEFEHFFVRSKMIWLDVMEVFAQNQTNIVPVLDEDNKYLGFYELEDVIQFFHETPFLKEDGGIIIVRREIAHYSMSQIAQIVESNDAKLLGLFVSKMETDFIEVTVKTNLTNINEIIQTFRRYEYEIISEHQEDSYLQNLKDRSDYLDKYLNI